MNLKFETPELEENIKQLNELIETLKKLNETAAGLAFVTPKKLSELAGCTVQAAQRIFNMPGFPCCDETRPQIAEVSAVREFFKERHCKNK